MSSSNSNTQKHNKKGFAPRVSVEGIKYCDSCNYVNTVSAPKCLLCGAELHCADNSSAADDTAFGTQGSTKKFKVTLNKTGEKKLEVIKAIQQITKCNLKEAKRMASNCPRTIIQNITREEAVKAADKLRALGASVTIE